MLYYLNSFFPINIQTSEVVMQHKWKSSLQKGQVGYN